MLHLHYHITFVVGGQTFHEHRQRVLQNFSNPTLPVETLCIYVTVDLDHNVVNFFNL